MRFLLHDFGLFGPAHPIGPACWPHFDLLWFHSGQVSFQLGEAAAVKLSAGSGVFIFPDTPFSGHALSPTAFASVQHFQVEASDALPAPLEQFRHQRNGGRVYRGFADSAVVPDIERAIQLAGEKPSAGSAQVRLLNLALILQQLENGPQPASREPGGHGLLAHWRRACRERPLARGTAPELARRFGFSAKKLRRELAAQGTTPREFLLGTRMEHARELLAGSAQPIKAIATAAGYADVVAFHRAFQKFHALTPATYRRQHRRRFMG